MWLPNCDALNTVSSIPINSRDSKLASRHFINYNGDWNWSLFDNLLPERIIQKMANFPLPLILSDWGATPDGSFTSKSAYITQMSTQPTNSGTNFNIIWKWKGNERVHTFLWKLGHESILTNVERHLRKMTDSKACPLCNDGDETLLHRFRDCHVSFAIL